MKKILIVDDEDEIRSLVKRMLEGEGYTVSEAESGQRCLDMLREGEKPDLILLDVMMPDMDGWEVSRRIKEDEKTKDIIVSMLTVRSQDEDMLKSLGDAGAGWHISKPIEKTKFLKTVRFLLK